MAVGHGTCTLVDLPGGRSLHGGRVGLQVLIHLQTCSNIAETNGMTQDALELVGTRGHGTFMQLGDLTPFKTWMNC